MTDHGEPWHTKDHFGIGDDILDRDNNFIATTSKRYAKLIVACVDPLKGVNPHGITAVLVSCNALLTAVKEHDVKGQQMAIDMIDCALKIVYEGKSNDRFMQTS